MTARIFPFQRPPVVKRSRQPKDYRAWLKAKGVKIHKIERTPKQAGEYEFDHNGKLVPCASARK